MAFFSDVLGVPITELEPDFGWSRLPDSSQFEVFGPSDTEHRHFPTGPVPEFLVDIGALHPDAEGRFTTGDVHPNLPRLRPGGLRP